MALKKFNSVEGFSVGSPGNVIDVVDNFANVYANRIFVEQYANLGDVGNVYIGGGLNNQVLKTDGSGGLFWALDTAPAGGNTTEVQFNNSGSLDGSSAFTFNNISNALSISGNLTSGNATLGNLATANYFSGNGSLLTHINSSNIDGQVANALISGTVYSNAQPNITSVGTLVDTVIAGANSLTGANLISANYFTGTLTTQSQPNITSVGSLATLNVLGNITSANASLGNLATANYFSGNGNLLTGVIANANYAAYSGNVINPIQSNITTVGALSSLSVTGLTTATGGVKTANILDTSGTIAIQTKYNTYSGDVGITSNLTVGASGTGNLTVNGVSNLGPVGNVYISGGSSSSVLITDGAGGLSWTNQVANALVAGTVTTNAQPNITSVGALSTLNVSGNVTSAYFIGNGSQLTGVVGSANYATYAGTVTTNAQPNITSVGTLSNLSVTGTFTKDNKNVTTYTSSTTVPTDPTVGDQWYDQTNDITYQYIYDGTSYYWVDISSGYIDSNVNAVASTLVLRDANANVYANYLIGSGLTVTDSANLGAIGNVKITGGTNGYLIQTDGAGNLSFVSAGSTGIAGSNTQIQFNDNGAFGASPGFTFNKTSNTLSVAGNVTASYFIGDGSQLTGLPASYSNTNVAAYLPTYTGNFTAGNISVTGNATSAYFIGNGSSLTSITAGNVSGQVANALVAGTVYTGAQPNITSVGTLVDANISGNLLVGGNLTVNGTTTYVNVDSLKIEDPIIELGGGANGATLTTNDGKDRGSLLHYYTTQAVDAFMGWDNSNGEFAFGSNVSVSGEIVTYNSFGNVRANNFIGNLSQASGINASNITSGTIPSSILGNSTLYVGTTSIALNRSSGSQSLTGISIDGSANYATYAGTVTTNAQPNITSVGTLTSVSVTANVSAGNVLTNNLLYANGVAWNLGGTYSNSNVASYLPTYTGNVGANFITATGNVTAAYFIGNGSQLTGLPESYANSNVAAYLPTYTGNIGANFITATGNVSASYFIGNGSQLTGLPESYANSNVALYLPTYTGLIGGTLTTQAQPNVTSLGTITDLDVSGNVTVDGTLYANAIVGPTSANVTITAGAFVSTFDEFGNITLSDNVEVIGNLTAANVKTDHLLYANGVTWTFGSTYSNANVADYLLTNTGNISAGYFIGNGSALTSITGGNVTGQVANALIAGTVYSNAQPNVTSVGTLSELTVNGLTDLGSVSNITISGGASGYVLTTDGSGSLTWSASGGSGGVSGFTSIVKDRFVTSGSANTFTLSTTPSAKNDIEVIIDGLQQISNTYSLTGAVLSFPTNPDAGQLIEVTTFGTVDLTGNVGEIQFNNGGEFGSSPALTFNSGSNTVTTGNLTVTGNLTSQAGYVYLDNAIIAVSSGNAGVFNTGVGNINLGLAANVTMGSTSGNVTARGTFNSNNAIVNTIGVSNYYSTRDPITVTTDTIIDQFPVNDYRSAKYTMRVNSDDGYQAVEVLLVHNGSSSYVTIYGSISSSGSDIVSLSSNIGSGNVRLFASTASTNTNVKILGTYVSD